MTDHPVDETPLPSAEAGDPTNTTTPLPAGAAAAPSVEPSSRPPAISGNTPAQADQALPQPSPKRGLRRTLSYVVVSLASLALGSALTFGAGRLFHGPPAPNSGAGASMPGMPGMGGESPARPAGAGESAVYISPARQQLIGVRTGIADEQRLETTLRVTAIIAYDETRVTEIHTKVSGWVEQLYVDFVGKPVRRGQPLLSIYSPDLVTAQNDLVIARNAEKSLGTRSSSDARAGADALKQAARSRLRRWDISERAIDELERTGGVTKTMTLSSPFAGVVLERNTYRGQYLTPETATFKIGDLSKVWVIGQIFEYELDRVKTGQSVSVEFPYGQAPEALQGKIDFVYPDVDPQTRRVRIRATFDNPGLALKPQTYVTLVIKGELAPQLTVPREAVIDTGERRYVILARPNGYFEPRDVEIGAPVEDRYPILRGLAAGDRVVVSAQFLVDSETNLQSAMQAMSMSMPGMDMGGEQQKAAPKSMPGMDMGGEQQKITPDAGPPPKTNRMPGMNMKDMPGMGEHGEHGKP